MGALAHSCRSLLRRLVSCADTNFPERTPSHYFGQPRKFARKHAYLFKTPYNYARANVNGICKRRFYFVTLCVEKRGYAARAYPLFAFFLIISMLRALYIYMLRRRDVHIGKTPSIPVAPEPIPVERKPFAAPRKPLRLS